MLLPGGFGAMDELFEVLALVGAGKITRFPIVLVGSEYWGGLLSWLKATTLADGKIGRGRRRRWFHARGSSRN